MEITVKNGENTLATALHVRHTAFRLGRDMMQRAAARNNKFSALVGLLRRRSNNWIVAVVKPLHA